MSYFKYHNHNINIIFFFFLLLLSTPLLRFSTASKNIEAIVLYSWLHPIPNATSPPSLSDWNIHGGDDVVIDPCKWSSITCSAHGFVTEIDIQFVPLKLPVPSNLSSLVHLRKLVISESNLTGAIPAEIGDCTELEVLDLSSNNLFGSIPESVGKLGKLETLGLNSNQLTGKIPVQIGKCGNLKNLVLFDNQLSGVIPSELGFLSKLEVFRSGGNKDIAGLIPYELGNCSNLTVLGLAETRVSGPIPTSLGALSKLQTLSIYTTMISGSIPDDLGNCTELVNLYLYQNSLSGSIPKQIGNLVKLEKLLLWQNDLVGAIPNEIGNCTRLKMIDLSLNSLSGTIPFSIGGLLELTEFMISDNNVSGSIPFSISNLQSLIQLQLDTNQISGLIPSELGMLSKLEVFFAWENQLEGSIPSSLVKCTSLQALDLSHNFLTGNVPYGLFDLQNLTKFLLISNDISGTLPTNIGNCTSLVRLRLGKNRITGDIPREIQGLKRLNFLDLSGNRLFGPVPNEIGECTHLQMVDFSNNTLEGTLPNSLSSLSNLQVLDVSSNRFTGQIPASLGNLVSLNKLMLSSNFFSGTIPFSLSSCSSLQLLDLSNNQLYGNIPNEICKIVSLEIALNLSWNALTGPIPPQILNLNKLSLLDLSHNKLEGSLSPLAGLDNLVSLNISYNNFAGYLPDNNLFRQLSARELAGNTGLCSLGLDSCFSSDKHESKNKKDAMKSWKLKLAIALLSTLTVAMLFMGIVAVIRARRTIRDDNDSELGDSYPWQFTPFQKLNFSVEQVLKSLVDSNVIGKGCSGVVYRADVDNGEFIAVKKLWPSTVQATNNDKSGIKTRDSFSAEVNTLGSIRHKNIVRFLGCCWNKNTRLLMYDYMPNGSLGSVLHERTGCSLEWELRYRILLGAAQGLAYLHHDCVPPIVHRDIKANNILIGLEFEPYIADFGLAKLVDDGDFAKSSNTVAGSYGYIAPEYGYMLKITEKSDVYSFGVVILEVLTGKQPIDPTIPDGLHVVDWVRQKRGGTEVLDPTLLSRPESEVEEIMQALGVALLCVHSSPDERPTMKDVAAMLKEIKHDREEYAKVDALLKGSRASESSSEKTTIRPQNKYPESNHTTSFSASSLLHMSASSSTQ